MRQPLLFENIAQTQQQQPPIARRRAEMRRVEKEASGEWKRAYEAFILKFAESHGGFTAEDVREAYAASGLPATHSQQASGGIFQRLVKQGRLKKDGAKVSRLYGNLLQAYSKP